MTEEPFDIRVALARLESAIALFPKAGLFLLKDEGHSSVFQQLTACILSIRTLDEVMLETARRLFAVAPTPEDMAALGPEGVDRIITRCAFHSAKARQISAIALRSANEFGGELPCDEAILRSLGGVGPKCANLVLGLACGLPRIAVDSHVHRVANRWGIVVTDSPEATLAALTAWVPDALASEVNRLIMPFGKHICMPISPQCSVCPLRTMCPRIGVMTSR